MDWYTQYSSNTNLKSTTGSVFLFKFPSQDGIHYIVKDIDGLKAIKLSMDFLIKGDNPEFYAPGEPPPKVRLYFQRKGDNMSGEGSMQFYRWWSNPISADLVIGRQGITVPLRPLYWSSVYGKLGIVNKQAFNDAVKNACRVGITFGSASQFGHGAWLKSGTAKFKLLQFAY